MSVVSETGKFVCVAGTRGFVIYWRDVGKFSTFGSRIQEQSFQCKMAFFEGEYLYFVAKASETDSRIIVLPIAPKLDLQAAIATLLLPEPPCLMVRLEISGEIVILLESGSLYKLRQTPLQTHGCSLSLELVGRLPAAIPAKKIVTISRFASHLSKYVLVHDGTTSSYNFATADFHIIDDQTEFLLSVAPLHESTQETVWLIGRGDFKILGSGKKCIGFTLDFVPLALNFAQGVLIGLSPRISSRRNFGALNYSFSPKSSLYLHHVLEHLLENHSVQAASEFGRKFSQLGYYNHALEMLLHQVWEREAEASMTIRPNALLPTVVTFIRDHNQYLDIVVNCARKTELCMWDYLFSIIGSPREFFYECLARNKLDAAAAFLVVLHNMESQSLSGSDSVKLLQKLLESENFDTCRDLIRFISNVDQQDVGQKLWESLQRRKTASPSPQSSPKKDQPIKTRGVSNLNPGVAVLKNGDSASLLSCAVPRAKKNSAPLSKTNPLQENVECIVSIHAVHLLRANRLRCLLQMARAIDFPLKQWLSKERNRAAVVRNYLVSLRQVHQQFHVPVPSAPPPQPPPAESKRNPVSEQDGQFAVFAKVDYRSGVRSVTPSRFRGDQDSASKAEPWEQTTTDGAGSASVLHQRRHSYNGVPELVSPTSGAFSIAETGLNVFDKKGSDVSDFARVAGRAFEDRIAPVRNRSKANSPMRDRRTASFIEHGFMDLLQRKVDLHADLRELARVTGEAGCLGWHLLLSAVLGDAAKIASAVIEHAAQKEWHDTRGALHSFASNGYRALIDSVSNQVRVIQSKSNA